MRLLIYTSALICILIIRTSQAEEQGWSWGEKSKDSTETKSVENPTQKQEDLQKSEERSDSTEIDDVVDTILNSGREGKSLDGFDELYSDPNVQDVLQKGDDGEARNIIKDKLCSLGLMEASSAHNLI